MAAPEATAAGILAYLLTLALGTIGGSLGTIVAFRTQFSHMKRDIADERKAREALAIKLDYQLQDVSRRTLETLRITASIARKVGADTRFDDVALKLLGAEDDTT